MSLFELRAEYRKRGSNLWLSEQLLILVLNYLVIPYFHRGHSGTIKKADTCQKGVRVPAAERSIEPKHEATSINLL